MADITCSRCGKEGAPLPFPPLNNDLGRRVQAEICQTCWGEWLRHQTMLINENRLSPLDPKHRAFLEGEMEKFLFGGVAERPPGYTPAS